MDAAVELGRNSVSKHQIQPEYGDEEADAGRDCRTRLVRPNYQARTRTENNSFSVFSYLTTSRTGNLTRLILTLFLKKNLNASRLSEHPSVRGKIMSKHLGGIIGCK